MEEEVNLDILTVQPNHKKQHHLLSSKQASYNIDAAIYVLLLNVAWYMRIRIWQIMLACFIVYRESFLMKQSSAINNKSSIAFSLTYFNACLYCMTLRSSVSAG